MNRLQFFLLLWVAWGTVCLAALAFIAARPKTWASWIDKENDYWVARGGFSGSFAEKIKKVEKSAAIKITVKILLGGNVLLSVVVIYMLLHFPAPRPFRATLPPPVKVVPHRQPAH